MPDRSEVRILLVAASPGRAKLGITANKDVIILRKELRQQIDEARRDNG